MKKRGQVQICNSTEQADRILDLQLKNELLQKTIEEEKTKRQSVENSLLSTQAEAMACNQNLEWSTGTLGKNASTSRRIVFKVRWQFDPRFFHEHRDLKFVLEPNATVADLQKLIQLQTGIEPKFQRLFQNRPVGLFSEKFKTIKMNDPSVPLAVYLNRPIPLKPDMTMPISNIEVYADYDAFLEDRRMFIR